MELPLTVDSFKNLFKQKVGKTPSVVGFGTPRTKFQGKLKGNEITIWKSISIYQKNNATTYATIEPNNSGITLTGETRIPNNIFFTYLLFGLLFNIIVPTVAITEGQLNERLDILIPLLAVVFVFTLIWPYFWFRRNVTRLSKDVEKEFYYWTK
ncbi:hypothetical protein [Fulvivirga ligni]|uniref:hypothetical protein n=1 Tax=Fulvivirga ligni TaxID=2904246 RepID=UPI001F1918CE|nr:hypothetical protein [Fulvivirga ligni]UII24235.1 hypothetical protein LVD16_13520 [Fulvivirga ligni]